MKLGKYRNGEWVHWDCSIPGLCNLMQAEYRMAGGRNECPSEDVTGQVIILMGPGPPQCFEFLAFSVFCTLGRPDLHIYWSLHQYFDPVSILNIGPISILRAGPSVFCALGPISILVFEPTSIKNRGLRHCFSALRLRQYFARWAPSVYCANVCFFGHASILTPRALGHVSILTEWARAIPIFPGIKISKSVFCTTSIMTFPVTYSFRRESYAQLEMLSEQ